MKKNSLKIIVIILSCILIKNNYIAQNDTTKTSWFKNLPDTAQLRILVEISDSCEINEMLDYANRALNVGEKIKAKTPNSKYMSYYAAAYSNKAYYYDQVGKIKESLEFNLIALSIREDIKDNIGMAESYNNLAFIFQQQGDYSSAISYYNKAETIYLNLNDKKGLASIYINLGYDYYLENKMDSSQLFFEKALAIAEKIKDVKAISYALNNLASIYHKKQLYEKSETAYLKSLALREQLGIKDGIARSHQNLGRFYFSINKFDKSLYHAKIANQKAYELSSPDLISSSSLLLSDLYYKQKKYQKAIDLLKIYIEMKDSILSDETRKISIKQKMKYEFEKQKALDDAAYEKQLAISAEQEKKQKVIIYSIAGGLALVILFSIVIFNRLQVTRKQKIVIEEQKQEVEQQKEIIEATHKEITDSITYAKRIQEAILPSHKVIKKYLPASFILYKPKDIVAGDFYWMESICHSDPLELSTNVGKELPTLRQAQDDNSNVVLFAAADCTGHGVPGAMVSVVCHNAMNRAVREFQETTPGKILDKTRELVIEQFIKSDKDVKDGMDIALCSLRFDVQGLKPENKETIAMLQYAGANNSLWIIRKKSTVENQKLISNHIKTFQLEPFNFQLHEVKANKQPIGKVDNPLPYTTHTFELQKEDTIYVFSDGYVDQFGGEKGKKYKAKAFKELLLSIQDKTMEEQKNIIDETFEKWKGSLEQIDDVCVIGVRV